MPSIYDSLTDPQKQRVDTIMGRSPGKFGKFKMALGFGSSSVREAHAQDLLANRLPTVNAGRRNSYGGDFYNANNIIGFTGNANNNPTVYYQRGNDFGHITTAHDIDTNIGKERIHSNANYNIANNVPITHPRTNVTTNHMQERIGNRSFHTSRSPALTPANGGNRQQLHNATLQHRNLKEMYK